MADYSALANSLVDPIYKPLEDSVNTQVADAQNDPYYTSLLSGLEATKNRSFSEIEGRAAGRGVAYGNIPSQQQGAYLGEKYLPAVAEVKKTQLDRINQLKQTLAELRSKRAESVLGQVNIYQDRDFKAAEAAKDRAAAAAKSAGNAPEWQVVAGAQGEALSDIQDYVNSGAWKNEWDTEKNFLPNMYKAYPELKPETIKSLTYQIRAPYEAGGGGNKQAINTINGMLGI